MLYFILPLTPVLRNGRTLVPLRGIFEALGAIVNWDENSQTVTVSREGIKILTITIGCRTATKNGAEIFLDVPAELINNRTMVPLRFVSETLGAKVDWDVSSNTVLISN